MADQNARQDQNLFPALTLHTGTAGTAETVRATAQLTGEQNVFIAGGTVVTGAGTQPVNVITGSQQTLGTVGTVLGLGTATNLGSVTNVGTVKEISNLAGGTVTVANPTGTTVTVDHGTITISNPTSNTVNVATGSQQTLGTVGTVNGVGTVTNLGSMTNFGTGKEVTTVANLTNGSINILTGTLQSSGTTTGVGTVTNLGSITNIGTAKEVTTVANLTNGSVNILTGTVTNVGTVPGIGTVTNLGSVTNFGTGKEVTTVANLTNGSVNLLTGTLTRASNVGTVESGTFQQNLIPVVQPLQYGTLGTAGGSAFGTISAASGAGTKHYVSAVAMTVSAGTVDCYIGFGTGLNGGSVLARGQYVPSAGINREFNPVMVSGTNSELCYELAGAGTVYFLINYWKAL